MRKLYTASLLLVMCMLMPALAFAQQRESFPGAEGYGRYTTGGRGGKVYHVTTLEDNNSPGSLRYACNQSGARTIVFDVDGTIHLKSELKLRNGNVTIAGQTAPGDGICIADYPFSISASNVIIRFMRFRLGSTNATLNGADGWDGLGALDQKDIIVDHCSVSWSIDECLSFSGCTRTTVQWCIVSQSLVNSGHSKGAHGYGGNWGGCKASYHHNLLAHHTSRAPRLGPRPTTQLKEQMDMRNNVIYNYSGESCYGGEGMKVNIVNNIYIPGPGNKYAGKSKRNRIAGIGIRNNEYVTTYPAYADALHLVGKFYVDGNYNPYPNTNEVSAANFLKSENQWKYGIYDQITWSNWDDLANTAAKQEEMKKELKSDTPIEYVYTTTHDYINSFKNVCTYAGASLHRDELDTTIANEARNMSNTVKSTGTGLDKGFINTHNDVKGLTGEDGWPKLNAGTAQTDTDGDGIPDDWESANGLNPNDAADGAKITADGYSNLEHYINSLVQDIMDKGNAGGKMLNGTLTFADAAVELPKYDPSYVPQPDPDDENENPGNGDDSDAPLFLAFANASSITSSEPLTDMYSANKTNNKCDGLSWDNGIQMFLVKDDKSFGGGETTTLYGKPIKLSNGAPNLIILPDGFVTKKIVFYGCANSVNTTTWVSDISYEKDGELVNVFKDIEGTTGVLTSYDNTEDKNAFKAMSLDQMQSITCNLSEPVSGRIWFKNGGKQPQFFINIYKYEGNTGIRDIISDTYETEGDGKIYNLMGVEVKGNLTPGIYIRNGKKFLVK